jgi:rhamnulokinase
MSRYFVACDLGEESGRVMLATLHKEQLTISEVLRFENGTLQEKDAVHWDMAQIYQDTLAGLRDVGAYQEPVDSISCTSWGADYLLFNADGSIIPPTFQHGEPRTEAGRKEVLKHVPEKTIFAETGVRSSRQSTLFQLGADKSRRVKRADHLMPVADGFNFLLSGVASLELSSASATQLFNPETRQWSEQLLKAVDLPAKLLPKVVNGGTKLKPLRPEIAAATGLENTHVVASCSNQIAASLVGLPIPDGEQWAWLQLGRETLIGSELPKPLINPASWDANLNHTLGYNGSVYCHAETVGLRILEECRQSWAEMGQELDDGVLAHLAATAEPLETLINFTDPRFATPGDLFPKIQAFCKETGQVTPRKPGPTYRCLLESLALSYRKTLDEITHATGREFTRLYLLGNSTNNLLNHFIANAMQLPITVAPAHASTIGNVLVQTVAMGRINSLFEARQIARQSFKVGTVLPHPARTWAPIYDRFLELAGARTEVATA